MRLRVKDLRQYLTLRNINTDTCREKEDLVDLVLCHLGAELEIGEDEEEEEEEVEEAEADTDSLPSLPRSLSTPPASTARSSSQQSALSVAVSQGEALSRSDSSGTTNQVRRFLSVTLPMFSHALHHSSVIECGFVLFFDLDA